MNNNIFCSVQFNRAPERNKNDRAEGSPKPEGKTVLCLCNLNATNLEVAEEKMARKKICISAILCN